MKNCNIKKIKLSIFLILTFIIIPIFLGYYAVSDGILISLSLILIFIGAKSLENIKRAIIYCVCQIVSCAFLWAYYIADNFIIKNGIIVYLIAGVIIYPVIYMIQNDAKDKSEEYGKNE